MGVTRLMGVFAIDPGSTTGVARAVFELTGQEKSMAAAMSGVEVESWEVGASDGIESYEQAVELVDEFLVWSGSLATYRGTDVALVMEDFILRTKSKERHALDSVRVIDGVRAVLVDRGYAELAARIAFQQPGDAKRFDNKRLRELGCYVVGSEHRRDATRHVLLWLSKKL